MLRKLCPLLGPCVLTFVIKMANIHETCSGGLACFLLNNLAFDSPRTLISESIKCRLRMLRTRSVQISFSLSLFFPPFLRGGEWFGIFAHEIFLGWDLILNMKFSYVSCMHYYIACVLTVTHHLKQELSTHDIMLMFKKKLGVLGYFRYWIFRLGMLSLCPHLLMQHQSSLFDQWPFPSLDFPHPPVVGERGQVETKQCYPFRFLCLSQSPPTLTMSISSWTNETTE